MEFEGFTYCCGAEEFGNLYATAKEIKAQFLSAIESTEDRPGAYIATTVPSQRSAVAALKSLKFRKVFTFTNSKTGNKVTLWAKKMS